MPSSLCQFDVFSNPDADSAVTSPYLVVLQHDLVDTEPTVVVAPLVRSGLLKAVSGLHLSVFIAGSHYTLALSDLFPILRRALPAIPTTSLIGRRDEIIRGLDRLFTGF